MRQRAFILLFTISNRCFQVLNDILENFFARCIMRHGLDAILLIARFYGSDTYLFFENSWRRFRKRRCFDVRFNAAECGNASGSRLFRRPFRLIRSAPVGARRVTRVCQTITTFKMPSNWLKKRGKNLKISTITYDKTEKLLLVFGIFRELQNTFQSRRRWFD